MNFNVEKTMQIDRNGGGLKLKLAIKFRNVFQTTIKKYLRKMLIFLTLMYSVFTMFKTRISYSFA